MTVLRTALLSVGLAVAGYASVSWLTHDFQVWTAEGARRLEVALQPVAMPPVVVDGPGIAPQLLTRWLAVPGYVTVVDFIYTRCQTVCLSLGSTFQQLQSSLQRDRATQAVGALITTTESAGGRVRLLSLSFDGGYDTPARLLAYAQKLEADPVVWQLARVPDIAQNALLLHRLGVVVVPDGRGDYEHNAALLVVDDQGRLVRIFDQAEQQLALDYARDLAQRQLP